MESSRRRKDISCGARPGEVGEMERIWEIWRGFPVSVERTRRDVKCWWVVKRRYSGAGAVAMIGEYISCCKERMAEEEIRRDVANYPFCRGLKKIRLIRTPPSKFESQAIKAAPTQIAGHFRSKLGPSITSHPGIEDGE